MHTHNYELFDNQLDHVFEEADLGVTIDYELRFEEHISKKVTKANSISGLIRRSFAYLDPYLFIRLYKTFVRPNLEYAQAVSLDPGLAEIDRHVRECANPGHEVMASPISIMKNA